MTEAVFNPHNKPVDELPIIFGFINGHLYNDVIGVLLAQDGTGLGSHVSSNETWSRMDLGIDEGYRPDRHKTFQLHYPDGYRMVWTTVDDKRLIEPFRLNQEFAEEYIHNV